MDTGHFALENADLLACRHLPQSCSPVKAAGDKPSRVLRKDERINIRCVSLEITNCVSSCQIPQADTDEMVFDDATTTGDEPLAIAGNGDRAGTPRNLANLLAR